MKKVISLLLISFLGILPGFSARQNAPANNLYNVNFSAGQNSGGVFNLLNVADNFIKIVTPQNTSKTAEDENRMFQNALEKFTQGNVTTAYNDFAILINNVNNDYTRLGMAYNLMNIGFFSLADISLSKINDKELFKTQIESLKLIFSPTESLTRDEEIYLAKIFSSVYFDNSAHEGAFDLNKKKSLLDKSDYANYLLAQALFTTKEYSNALTYINSAIVKNPFNVSYQYYKSEILVKLKDNKNALKVVEAIGNKNLNTYGYDNKLLAQKELILSNLVKNPEEKSYHNALKYYYSGEYQKAVKECLDAIAKDKKAYDVYSLLGDCYVKTDNIAKAQKSYEQSLVLNKKYSPALIGLGNLSYFRDRLDEALNYYNDAVKYDKNNDDAMYKIASIYKQKGMNAQADEFEKKANSINPYPYRSFYSIGLLNQNSSVEYLKKSIAVNPLYVPTWIELARLEINNKNAVEAQKYLYPVSFVANENYLYYFYSGIAASMLNNNAEAAENFRKTLKINPDFSQAKYELDKINPL